MFSSFLFRFFKASAFTFVVALAVATLWGLSAASAAEPQGLAVRKLGDLGPWEIIDGDTPILRYNYQPVLEPPEVTDRISAGSRKYAVARSDYLHPLYGPRGEVLTEDWSHDHPHHRGFYWAWPEVDWQGRRGDLHALQAVFARPTGNIQSEEGTDFVQIVAENQWQWEDGTPIVREQATLRAWRKTAAGRAIDLQFRFTALDADVHVARRGTKEYGGLNVRLSAAPDQQIETSTDPITATPRRAWAQRSGTPQGGQGVIGITILQHPTNPDYPGDWVQYPNLSWVQPTFPAADTRYAISQEKPLVLRYRLWIHEGRQTPETIQAWWDAYQAETR
jgi:hypothetical protein